VTSPAERPWIVKADCKHCGVLIYLSGGSVLWRDYAVAEGMNGGYCATHEDGSDHEPIPGSMR
jgi:hypothetical protein